MSATIQRINKIEAIEGADNIEKAKVMEWECVVKKGEFNEGDLCVYCEIDSLLPSDAEWAKFMEPRKFLVKTIKLRGVLSQGLILPLSIVNKKVKEEDDVSELLNIKHYEKPATGSNIPISKWKKLWNWFIYIFLRKVLHLKESKTSKEFPTHLVSKTDELMLQSYSKILEELKGKECYITVKCDGSSATYIWYKKKQKKLFEFFFGSSYNVYSRNNIRTKDRTSVYAKLGQKYNLEKIMKKDGRNLAIQGEACGPSIQKNRLQLSQPDLFIFNIFDIDKKRLFNDEEMLAFCRANGLKTVPLLGRFVMGEEHTVEWFLNKAKGFYDGTKQRREGIVVRPVVPFRSVVLKGKWASFKVLNNDYLLKDE